MTKTQLVELPASTPSCLLGPASESSPPLWATLSDQETLSSLSRPPPTRSVANYELRTRFPVAVDCVLLAGHTHPSLSLIMPHLPLTWGRRAWPLSARRCARSDPKFRINKIACGKNLLKLGLQYRLAANGNELAECISTTFTSCEILVADGARANNYNAQVWRLLTPRGYQLPSLFAPCATRRPLLLLRQFPSSSSPALRRISSTAACDGRSSRGTNLGTQLTPHSYGPRGKIWKTIQLL